MPFLTPPPPAPPRRIVSLCPSVTETLFALGAWDRVVGRTRYCVHPRGLVQAVPHCDGTKNPDLERLFALSPDLVIAVKEENRQEDVAALVAAGLPLLLLDPSSVEEAADAARELGDAIDHPIEGELLARRIKRGLDSAHAAAAGQRRPRVAYLVWWEPAMLAGDDTFIGSLLTAVGLDNAAPRGRYPQLCLSDLAELGLDAVLLPSEPYPFKERHREEVAAALALPPAQVLLVDGELLSWHGSRTVQGLEYAAALAATLRPDG